MNDLLLLSLLLEEPKHGYRLKREAGFMLGQVSMHSNLVYPLLRRFVREGLVIQKKAQGERGQTRKVYALTTLGRRTLIERVSQYSEEEAGQSEPFQVRVGLFTVLAPEVRERILTVRENALRARDQRLAALQKAMDLGLYGGDIVRHLRESIKAELGWIRRLRQLQKNQTNESEKMK